MDSMTAIENFNMAMSKYVDALCDTLHPLMRQFQEVVAAVYLLLARASAVLWLTDHRLDHPLVIAVVNRLPIWLLPRPDYLLGKIEGSSS